jgi:hypothetical protein
MREQWQMADGKWMTGRYKVEFALGERCRSEENFRLAHLPDDKIIIG